MQPALLILFSPNKAYPSAVNLTLNETNLQQVNSCRYLGIIGLVDDELKWKPHIDVVTQKLKKVIGICYKVRYKLPEWCLCNIYFAFVYTYITCGLEIYGNTCVTYLNKLTTLNNKIHRILQRKSPRCCTTCFHIQYNILPPAQLFTCHVINLVYTRSSAIAEGPRDASCQLKSCQLPRNSAETTYTSPDQIDGMKLEVQLEAMRDKQADDGRVVYITCIPTTCCGEIF